MDNALGALIRDEVDRAEADFAALRTRGQTVLTASGGLVTLLGGLLVIAVGRDATMELSALTVGAAVVAILLFISATVMVLLMYLPSEAEVPDSADLAHRAEKEWDSDWDQDVALMLVKYLTSLRRANATRANQLALAVGAEVLALVGVAVMALTLIPRL